MDVAVRAVAVITERRPDLNVALDIYGSGDTEPALQALAADLGVAARIAFHGRVPIDAVPARIAAADIGIAPTRLDRFTGMSLSGKVFEYGAMGKPVVATRLPMVEATFPPGSVSTYSAGDPASMADAIIALADDPIAREAAVAQTGQVVRERSWEHESVGYLALIERLIAARGSR
jgi:glycosyltransferase involved in cell wall biosynthesis